MIWILLIIFQLKHFLADYPLQGKYMLGKFKSGIEWVGPLSLHASVHALITLYISVGFFIHQGSIVDNIWLCYQLAFLDFFIHFVVDRVKASPNMLGRFKALSANEFPNATPEQVKNNKYFWWALGADQLSHHLTNYLIIFILVS